MSHFYGRIQGNRGKATRCGSKSGYVGSVNGWNEGIDIRANHNEERKEDSFQIWANGGSNRIHGGLLIATISNKTIHLADGMSIPTNNYYKYIENLKAQIVYLKL